MKEFAEIAKTWIGVRYSHRGITRRGCDCTGLLIGIANELGYLLNYKLRMYARDWSLHAGAGNYVVEELEKFGNEISNEEVEVGDVLVFSFGKCLAHVGVLVNKSNMLFVHSFLTAKRCKYAILKNSIWSKRWKKTYRISNDKMVLYK